MLTYCYEAKLRIAQQGPAAIAGFLDSVPQHARQKLFASLPTVPGFRKGNPLELKERSKKLISTLSHVADARFRVDGPEWVVLANIWSRWASARLGDTFLAPDLPPGQYDKEGALKFFQDFLKRCGDEGCPREDADQLFRFSGFPDFEDITTLIEKLPSREVVEQRKKYAQLPSEVNNLRGRLEHFERELQTAKKEVQGVSSKLLMQTASSDKASAEVEALVKDLKSIQDMFAASKVETDKRLQSLSTEVAATKEASSVQATQITSVGTATKGTAAEYAGLTRLVARVENSFKEFQEHVELKFKKFDRLGERPISHTDASTQAVNRLRITRLKNGAAKSTCLKDPNSALSLIAANIVAVGVHASEADEVAQIVLVAALSGQIVQLTGSVAEVLAQGICTSLGGGDYLAWDVPLGLCDGEQTARVLECMRAATEKPYCLYIRGINKSAFEIYGDDMRQLTVARQLELNTDDDCWPAIASWADGPSTLPGGAQLTSLGPLIDADKLSWSRAKPGKLQHGFLDVTALSAVIKDGADADELSDLVKDIERVAAPLNQFRRRQLWRTASFLLGLPQSDTTKSFQLAVAYWALPWAKAHDISREDIALQIRKLYPGAQEMSTIAKGLADLSEEDVN